MSVSHHPGMRGTCLYSVLLSFEHLQIHSLKLSRSLRDPQDWVFLRKETNTWNVDDSRSFERYLSSSKRKAWKIQAWLGLKPCLTRRPLTCCLVRANHRHAEKSMGTRRVFVHVGNGRGSIGFSYTEDLSINQAIHKSIILSICAQPPLNQNSRASIVA